MIAVSRAVHHQHWDGALFSENKAKLWRLLQLWNLNGLSFQQFKAASFIFDVSICILKYFQVLPLKLFYTFRNITNKLWKVTVTVLIYFHSELQLFNLAAPTLLQSLEARIWSNFQSRKLRRIHSKSKQSVLAAEDSLSQRENYNIETTNWGCDSCDSDVVTALTKYLVSRMVMVVLPTQMQRIQNILFYCSSSLLCKL